MGFSIKKTIKKVTKKATGLVKNVVNSPVKVVSSLAKGDIVGAATNLANVASLGTIDTTGKNNGIVNVNTEKYVNKAITGILGIKGISPSTSSEVDTYVGTQKKKGLLSQLRQGKGSVGGGSYTVTVKNPLGGSSGITGK